MLMIDRQDKVSLNLSALRGYSRRLRAILKLTRNDFSICFVSDREIKRLNSTYRGVSRPTDVLSFPWRKLGEGFSILSGQGALSRGKSAENPRARLSKSRAGEGSALARPSQGRSNRIPTRKSADHNGGDGEFRGYLGDVVISAETARRNARAEGHSTHNEVRWLILHGLLHLLGYDHEADHGEMIAFEHSLRARLCKKSTV